MHIFVCTCARIAFLAVIRTYDPVVTTTEILLNASTRGNGRCPLWSESKKIWLYVPQTFVHCIGTVFLVRLKGGRDKRGVGRGRQGRRECMVRFLYQNG